MHLVKRGPNGGAILRDDDGSEFESAHPVALHALDHLEGKCALCSGGVAGHMDNGGVGGADPEPQDPKADAPYEAEGNAATAGASEFPDPHGRPAPFATGKGPTSTEYATIKHLPPPDAIPYGKGPTLEQYEAAHKKPTTATSEAPAPAATQIGPDAGMKNGGVMVGKPPAGMSEEDFAAAQAASNASPDASAPPASTFDTAPDDSQQVADQASGETGVDDSIALLNAEQPTAPESAPPAQSFDTAPDDSQQVLTRRGVGDSIDLLNAEQPTAPEAPAPSDGVAEVPTEGVKSPATDAVHTVPAENQSDAKKAYFQAYADKVAAAMGVPPARLKAHLDWESGHTWDPNFVSAPNKDGTHDAGLGSFNDGGTAQKYRLIDKDGDHRHDPLRAIRATAAKLADDAGPEKDWDKASRMYNPGDPKYLGNILATEKRFGGSGVATQTQDGQVAGEQVGEPAPEQPEGETPMPPPLETPPGAPGGGETAEAQALDPNNPNSIPEQHLGGGYFAKPQAKPGAPAFVDQAADKLSAPLIASGEAGAAATQRGEPRMQPPQGKTALEQAKEWASPPELSDAEHTGEVAQSLGNRAANLEIPKGDIEAAELKKQADLTEGLAVDLDKHPAPTPEEYQRVNNYHANQVQDRLDAFQKINTDPNAIWRNAGAGSKFLQVLGSFLGGIKQGLVGGDNPAETHLNNFINQEAEHIKNAVGVGRESVGMAGELWKQHLRGLGDQNSATAALRANLHEVAAQRFQAMALSAQSPTAKLTAQQSFLHERQAAIAEGQRAAAGGTENYFNAQRASQESLKAKMAPYERAPEIAAQSFDAKLRAATSGQQTQPFTTAELMAGRARLGGALDKDPETDEAGYYTRGAPPPADKERITYAGAATSGIRAAVAGIRAGHEAGLPYTEDRGSWHIRMRHIEENMAKAHGIELRGEALDDQTDEDFPYTNSPAVTALPFLMNHLADMQNTKRGIQGSHGWQATPVLRPLVPGSR